jgi:uncharacterized protein (DUF983 family)
MVSAYVEFRMFLKVVMCIALHSHYELNLYMWQHAAVDTPVLIKMPKLAPRAMGRWVIGARSDVPLWLAPV